LSQYLAKGRRVGIDGRLDWRSWEAQDGTKRSKVDVVAQNVQFLDSRGADGEGGGSQYVPAGAAAQAADADFTPSAADDDIPF
jgi:single-strand DNA-binding protein